MKPYKKRLKGGWRQGKAYKGDGEERQYAKAEIKQAIKELEADYKDKYKKSQRKRNEIARLEYRIKWCDETIARYGPRTSDWGKRFEEYCRDDKRKAVKRLAELKALKKI